jgi:hypothetical protein
MKLNLMGARWYDPALSRWTQPDSIIPGIQGIQGFDRYAYVNNSPIRFNDPTGCGYCDRLENLDDPECWEIEEDYNTYAKTALKDKFQWRVHFSWSNEELHELLKVGDKILHWANGFFDGDGKAWMDKYLGNLNIFHFYEAWGSMAIGNNIFLGHDWLNSPWDPQTLFTHELGHVFETRTGMNVSDWLNEYIGGDGGGFPKWNNGTRGIPQELFWDQRVHGGYGNRSTMDYFAEAFTWLIYDPTNIPQSNTLNVNIVEWMNVLLRVLQ